MPPLDPIDDLPPGVHLQLVKEARETLKQVHLHSFTAIPGTVLPFGESVLAWDVTGPEGQFTLTLNADDVPLVGTRPVRPLATMTFRLQASAYVLQRTLGQLTVSLDENDSQVFVFRTSAATDHMRAQLHTLLETNETLKLRGNGGHATITDEDGLTFHVTLEVKVPNWFNADFDLDLRYMVFLDYTSPTRDVRVLQRPPSVDVRWHPLEHLLSLGCTGAVQAALEHVLLPLLRETLGDQVRREIRRHLQQATDDWATKVLNPEGDDSIVWRRFRSSTFDGEIEFRFSLTPIEPPSPPLSPVGAVVVAPIGISLP